MLAAPEHRDVGERGGLKLFAELGGELSLTRVRYITIGGGGVWARPLAVARVDETARRGR